MVIKMKVILNGANGRMGKTLTPMLLDGVEGSSLAAAVDINSAAYASFPIYERLSDFDGEADVIIDFTRHSTVSSLLEYAVTRKIPAVIATTGHTDEEMELIKKASEKIAIFKSANMSFGIALLAETAKRVASMMTGADIEIVETHHRNKLDAPSGTALLLADALLEVRPGAELVKGRAGMHKREDNEIGISSLRYGNVVGDHEIIISDGSESIRLRHEAHDRDLFAKGALRAAKFLVNCGAGIYNMDSMLKQM